MQVEPLLPAQPPFHYPAHLAEEKDPGITKKDRKSIPLLLIKYGVPISQRKQGKQNLAQTPKAA